MSSQPLKLVLTGLLILLSGACGLDTYTPVCTEDDDCETDSEEDEDEDSPTAWNGGTEGGSTTGSGTTGGTSTGGTGTSADFATISSSMSSLCLPCHSAESREGRLDLESDPCLVLVDVESTGYRPALRVSAGLSSASVLWHKVSDSGVYGGRMPPMRDNPSEVEALADQLDTWISEGALCE